MPRASWKGFLRLSLVSCPIYLSPATTRTKSTRLHQVWQPKAARSAPIEDDEEEERKPFAPAKRSAAYKRGTPALVFFGVAVAGRHGHEQQEAPAQRSRIAATSLADFKSESAAGLLRKQHQSLCSTRKGPSLRPDPAQDNGGAGRGMVKSAACGGTGRFFAPLKAKNTGPSF